MQVLKVFLVNGEVHSYPIEDVPIVSTDANGYLDLAKREDDEGKLEELVAGYPAGVWKYYRVFNLKDNNS